MKTCDRSFVKYRSREERFRKSLRSFLSYNFVIFIFMIFGIGGTMLWKISVIWGAILAFKGYGLYGREEDGMTDDDEPSREQYGRPKRPQWKDKDLV